MKYRKKPIVVHAEQWWPPSDGRHNPGMLTHRKGNAVDPPDYRQMGDLYLGIRGGMPGCGGCDVFVLRTPFGDLKVLPGHWVVTDGDGDKSMIKPHVFELEYEDAESYVTDATTDMDETLSDIRRIADHLAEALPLDNDPEAAGIICGTLDQLNSIAG